MMPPRRKMLILNKAALAPELRAELKKIRELEKARKDTDELAKRRAAEKEKERLYSEALVERVRKEREKMRGRNEPALREKRRLAMESVVEESKRAKLRRWRGAEAEEREAARSRTLANLEAQKKPKVPDAGHEVRVFALRQELVKQFDKLGGLVEKGDRLVEKTEKFLAEQKAIQEEKKKAEAEKKKTDVLAGKDVARELQEGMNTMVARLQKLAAGQKALKTRIAATKNPYEKKNLMNALGKNEIKRQILGEQVKFLRKKFEELEGKVAAPMKKEEPAGKVAPKLVEAERKTQEQRCETRAEETAKEMENIDQKIQLKIVDLNQLKEQAKRMAGLAETSVEKVRRWELHAAVAGLNEKINAIGNETKQLRLKKLELTQRKSVREKIAQSEQRIGNIQGAIERALGELVVQKNRGNFDAAKATEERINRLRKRLAEEAENTTRLRHPIT